MFEKISLNKYENRLSTAPAGKTYGDPRVQRAYNNLQMAKSKKNIAKGIMEFSTDTTGVGQAAAVKELGEAQELIRKNRGTAAPIGKLSIKPSTANTGDVLKSKKGKPKDLTNMLKRKDNITPGRIVPDKNKFLSKALGYIKKNPVKSGLMGLAAGGAMGVAAYGIKKDLED